MRNEREMVRALVSGRAFRSGLTFQDAELAGIEQPTLYMYGTADPVGTVDVWRRVVGLLPRGELRLVDGGHVPWLDDPSQVSGHVRHFLGA
jgi:2-hydroxy-6-oxonona-2,4-dienedioate hydrolase